MEAAKDRGNFCGDKGGAVIALEDQWWRVMAEQMIQGGYNVARRV